MDSASLNKLKVAELQQLLKDRGLGASGNKAERSEESRVGKECRL